MNAVMNEHTIDFARIYNLPMISKPHLEKMKRKNIGDVGAEELKDISNIVIDKNKPVTERILLFIEQIGNPYLFKVGNTPVKVSFTPNALTFQKSLEILFTKNV
jgi:hypothetical protein